MSTAKIVLITGAARGMGQTMASAFADAGYRVIIHYWRSQEQALALHDQLSAAGCDCSLFRADVADSQQVDKLVDFSLQRYGQVDVLVNNAAVSYSGLLQEMDNDAWQHLMAVNLHAVFYTCRALLPHMIARKSGKIINISSVWGMTGASCEVAYSASKAAVIGLTKALAKEVGPSNIQVNAIAPGVVHTDMLREYSADDLQELAGQTPLLRLGRPEDIAACTLFLASAGADFITGQVISPNGGFVI